MDTIGAALAAAIKKQKKRLRKLRKIREVVAFWTGVDTTSQSKSNVVKRIRCNSPRRLSSIHT